MYGGRNAVCLLLLLATGAWAGDQTCDAGECGADEAALLARKADIQKHGYQANDAADDAANDPANDTDSQVANTFCNGAANVPSPQAQTCTTWYAPGTSGDNCQDDNKGACMCRMYNLWKNGCPICQPTDRAQACTLRYCFDIKDLPDGTSCQWMFNNGDDCKQSSGQACRDYNKAACPCPCGQPCR